MKKVILILGLDLLLSNNANTSIIEIGKCMSGSLNQIKADYNLE